VRRLACDGSVVTIVEEEHGTPLDVGRKQPRCRPRSGARSGRATAAARSRDAAARTTSDAHHIRHGTNGGETSLENTTLLCTHHHTLLHEGGFTIERDERGGGIYFRRPDGRVIPARRVSRRGHGR